MLLKKIFSLFPTCFSRAKLEEEMVRSLGSALDSLAAIWEEIGILPEQRNTRTEVVMVHMRNLLDKMVKEEEGLRAKLLSNVKKYTSDLQRLTEELKLPTHQPEEGLSILQLEKSLRARFDALNKERHARVRILRTLKEKDQHLCDVLCSTPYYIPSGSVPSKEQLDELEKHVNDLEKEKVSNLIFSSFFWCYKFLDELAWNVIYSGYRKDDLESSRISSWTLSRWWKS